LSALPALINMSGTRQYPLYGRDLTVPSIPAPGWNQSGGKSYLCRDAERMTGMRQRCIEAR